MGWLPAVKFVSNDAIDHAVGNVMNLGENRASVTISTMKITSDDNLAMMYQGWMAWL